MSCGLEISYRGVVRFLCLCKQILGQHHKNVETTSPYHFHFNVHRSTENLTTPTSTWTLDHISIPPTYKLFFQPCHTVLSMIRWHSSRPLSEKMGIVSNRYDSPSTWRLELLSWKRSPAQLLFFHMSSWHTAGSSECWPNTTSNMLTCCLGRFPVFFFWWRMT